MERSLRRPIHFIWWFSFLVDGHREVNVRQLQWWTSSFNFLVRDWERTGGPNEPKDPPSSQGGNHADLPRCLLPSPLRQHVVALPLVTPILVSQSVQCSHGPGRQRGPLVSFILPILQTVQAKAQTPPSPTQDQPLTEGCIYDTPSKGGKKDLAASEQQ